MANSEKKKWAFIVNPIAGNGFGEGILPELRKKVDEYGIDAEIVITSRHGEASELSADFLKKGFNYIIAVGGDGTMNEVANPLIGQNDVVTGLVPAGTGNDFIQILGFPDRFGEEHWKSFFDCSITNMDTGTCNGILFLNALGLGFDGEVAAKNYVAPGETKKGGKIKYTWMILSTLLFFREKKAKITSNGTASETTCFMNTIGNGRRSAGAFYLTPNAIANDGELDVCLITKLNLLQRLKIFMMVPKGTHLKDKHVHYHRTKKLTLEFPMEVPFHVDGEVHFAKKYVAEIHPNTLRIIYNPTGPHYLNVD